MSVNAVEVVAVLAELFRNKEATKVLTEYRELNEWVRKKEELDQGQ